MPKRIGICFEILTFQVNNRVSRQVNDLGASAATGHALLISRVKISD